MGSADAEWSDFFVAAAGVAGALAGLVFVALSINLARILELPSVPSRAGETILLLAAALIGALLGLVPLASQWPLGVALLVVWLPTWLIPSVIQIREYHGKHYHRRLHAILRFVLHQIATAPFLLAGLSTLGCLPGGMLWLALALLLAVIVALINAWVLLVEILR